MTKKATTGQVIFRWALTAAIPLAGLIYVMLTMDVGQKKVSGKELYETHCGNCHGNDGKGLKSLYPPLAGAEYLKAHAKDLPCIIRYGIEEPLVINGKRYETPMVGIPQLSARAVAKISNYVNETWGDPSVRIGEEEAQKKLNRCPGQIREQ